MHALFAKNGGSSRRALRALPVAFHRLQPGSCSSAALTSGPRDVEPGHAGPPPCRYSNTRHCCSCGLGSLFAPCCRRCRLTTTKGWSTRRDRGPEPRKHRDCKCAHGVDIALLAWPKGYSDFSHGKYVCICTLQSAPDVDVSLSPLPRALVLEIFRRTHL